MAKSIRGDREKGMGPEPTSPQLSRNLPTSSRQSGPALSLADIDPALVIEALDAALDTGALLGLGRTSDGGAIGVYITNDGQRFKEWASEADTLTAILESIRDWGESTRT